MNPLSRLENELAAFILFGGLMEKESRRLTAELMFRHLYEARFNAKEKLAKSDIPEKYPHWASLLEQLFDQKTLRDLTHNNEDFAFSVGREALEWCKTTYQTFERNSPLFDEHNKLKQVQKNITELPKVHWETLLEELVENYSSHHRAWDFYKTRLDTLPDEPAKDNEQTQPTGTLITSDFQVLKRNITDDWENLLMKKKNTLEAHFLKESFEKYYDDLNQKVDQLNSLGLHLFPYYNFLGKSWNSSLENWNQIQWDKLEEYAYTLQQDRQLRELAELLGRFHVNATLMKEQAMLKPKQNREWKPNPYGKSEIIGITYSDQISAVLPSEIAFMSHPETEIIFDLKFIEKKLLTFQYRSQDLSSSKEAYKTVTKQSHTDNKGPIILCIDTSGSMFGHPERIAKALAFAILEIALREKRQAYLISFSTAIRCIEMTGMEEDLGRMIDFLKMSFHGGTDLQPALKKAIEMIQTETYQHADVLVISDFVIPRMERRLIESIHETRDQNNTHFHSMYITRRPNLEATPLTIFDNHWLYDLNNPRVIRQTLNDLEGLVD